MGYLYGFGKDEPEVLNMVNDLRLSVSEGIGRKIIVGFKNFLKLFFE